MLEEKKFIDEIWSKYKKYSEDRNNMKPFFNKKIGRNMKYLVGIKSFSLCLVTIICTILFAGGVYAGIKATVKSDEYYQEYSTIKDSDSLGFSYVEDMTYVYETDVYYKKINTYEEYMKYRTTYNNFIEMKEDEFDEYFLLVFLGGNSWDRLGLYIDTIDVMDDTIRVNIGRKEDQDNALVFGKIRKENNRENIEIEFLERIPNMTNYTPMKDLPQNYTKEQAIKDNCVVIGGGKSGYISRPDALKEFIRKTESGINDNIRVVEDKTDEGYGMIIIDIEFKDGEYIACRDLSRFNAIGIATRKRNFTYLTTNKIVVYDDMKEVKEMYILNGKYSEQIAIIVQE